MDDATKISIEKSLDYSIKHLNRRKSLSKITDWFAKDLLVADMALFWTDKDFNELSEELAVGYIIGYLANMAHDIVLDRKWREKVSWWTPAQVKEFAEMKDEEKEKLRLKLSNQDIKDVREIIKSKIPVIRTEVNRALNI